MEKGRNIFFRYANLKGELSHQVSLKSEGVLIILDLVFKKVYSLDIIFCYYQHFIFSNHT